MADRDSNRKVRQIKSKKTNSKDKITKYRKPLNINLGLIIFGSVFVYIIILIFLYFTSSHITGYEVKMGSLAVNNTYRGLIMRTEKIYQAAESGYINYYAREDERVAVGSMVYTVDESGKLSELVNSNIESGKALSDEDLEELKNQIMTYRNGFSEKSFDSVYDFKFSVEGTVMKLANQNVLSSLDNLTDSSVKDLINFSYSDDSGIIVYSTDGYENVTMDDITQESFNEENYTKNQLHSNSLISTGDPIYKLITSENWSIVVPIDEKRAALLEETEYQKVKFLKTGDISWGTVNIIRKNDKEIYLKIDFTNSMITFATDRFLEIELLTNEEEGLKIPNSAVVEKDFYLIPKEYVTLGKDGEKQGFLRETYLEDGSVSTEFVETEIYYEEDGQYYVDTGIFRIGDYINKLNSTEKYPISKKGTLIGVYNMNKGYADFTQISILYQNEEYSIVKSNTDYGLNVYDHIVLDGKKVNDDDFIFE